MSNKIKILQILNITVWTWQISRDEGIEIDLITKNLRFPFSKKIKYTMYSDFKNK